MVLSGATSPDLSVAAIAKPWYNASGIWRETVSAILGLTQINQELKFLAQS